MKNELVKLIENSFLRTDIPIFKAGATINVHVRISEGNKERIQQYKGVVIQRKGTGATETITVRKESNGVGVERIFPLHSPSLDKIEVIKHGRVRRARIYYMRNRSGKKARIREDFALAERSK
jgi:large subunit ribosomal protein L19